MKRIGILTGGGDSPSLNAAIRAVTRHAILGHGWQVVGIRNGFAGLVTRHAHPLGLPAVRELLLRGGTMLGASNRSNPFAFPVVEDGKSEARDLSGQALANIEALELSALVAIGGDGTLSIARRLAERGAPIVGIPKTIDNDVLGTERTLGHATAVAIATEALDRLHTTAESHDRVMLCEVMGRYAGWIALAAGIAGGADVIVIPEIPYRLDRIVAALEARRRRGRSFALIAVAEGARPEGGELAVTRAGDPTRAEKLGGAAERLAAALAPRLPEHELRVTVLGHVQRGGPPAAEDRLLATRFGVAAVDLIAGDGLGRAVALEAGAVISRPLAEMAAGAKRVDPDGEWVRAARATGVELG